MQGFNGSEPFPDIILKPMQYQLKWFLGTVVVLVSDDVQSD